MPRALPGAATGPALSAGALTRTLKHEVDRFDPSNVALWPPPPRWGGQPARTVRLAPAGIHLVKSSISSFERIGLEM